MNVWRAPGSRFAPFGLARQPGPNADITDLDAIVTVCRNIDAVVPLAASRAIGTIEPENAPAKYGLAAGARTGAVAPSLRSLARIDGPGRPGAHQKRPLPTGMGANAATPDDSGRDPKKGVTLCRWESHIMSRGAPNTRGPVFGGHVRRDKRESSRPALRRRRRAGDAGLPRSRGDAGESLPVDRGGGRARRAPRRLPGGLRPRLPLLVVGRPPGAGSAGVRGPLAGGHRHSWSRHGEARRGGPRRRRLPRHRRQRAGIGVRPRHPVQHAADLRPDGSLLGRHRKLVPTYKERTVWGAGDGSTLAVHPTPLGRIGGLICWENFMPLARYHQYAQGVQVHAAVTVDDSPSWQTLVRTIAAEGRVYVVAVCQRFARSQFPDHPLLAGFPPASDVLSGGGSLIVAPGGEVLAGPLEGGEGILTAQIDLGRVVAEKHSLDVAGHYARPDIFRLTVDEAPAEPFHRLR